MISIKKAPKRPKKQEKHDDDGLLKLEQPEEFDKKSMAYVEEAASLLSPQLSPQTLEPEERMSQKQQMQERMSQKQQMLGSVYNVHSLVSAGGHIAKVILPNDMFTSDNGDDAKVRQIALKYKEKHTIGDIKKKLFDKIRVKSGSWKMKEEQLNPTEYGLAGLSSNANIFSLSEDSRLYSYIKHGAIRQEEKVLETESSSESTCLLYLYKPGTPVSTKRALLQAAYPNVYIALIGHGKYKKKTTKGQEKRFSRRFFYMTKHYFRIFGKEEHAKQWEVAQEKNVPFTLHFREYNLAHLSSMDIKWSVAQLIMSFSNPLASDAAARQSTIVVTFDDVSAFKKWSLSLQRELNLHKTLHVEEPILASTIDFNPPERKADKDKEDSIQKELEKKDLEHHKQWEKDQEAAREREARELEAQSKLLLLAGDFDKRLMLNWWEDTVDKLERMSRNCRRLVGKSSKLAQGKSAEDLESRVVVGVESVAHSAKLILHSFNTFHPKLKSHLTDSINKRKSLQRSQTASSPPPAVRTPQVPHSADVALTKKLVFTVPAPSPGEAPQQAATIEKSAHPGSADKEKDEIIESKDKIIKSLRRKLARVEEDRDRLDLAVTSLAQKQSQLEQFKHAHQDELTCQISALAQAKESVDVQLSRAKFENAKLKEYILHLHSTGEWQASQKLSAVAAAVAM